MRGGGSHVVDGSGEVDGQPAAPPLLEGAPIWSKEDPRILTLNNQYVRFAHKTLKL